MRAVAGMVTGLWAWGALAAPLPADADRQWEDAGVIADLAASGLYRDRSGVMRRIDGKRGIRLERYRLGGQGKPHRHGRELDDDTVDGWINRDRRVVTIGREGR